MPDMVNLGPLNLHHDDRSWCFTLANPSEQLLEVPPRFEAELAERLSALTPVGGPPPRVVLDLEGLPALSSRQLGVLISLHKAVRSRSKRLPVVGTSAGVRHLFAVTRTGQFFEVE